MSEFWDKPAEKSGKVLEAFLEGLPLGVHMCFQLLSICPINAILHTTSSALFCAYIFLHIYSSKMIKSGFSCVPFFVSCAADSTGIALAYCCFLHLRALSDYIRAAESAKMPTVFDKDIPK